MTCSATCTGKTCLAAGHSAIRAAAIEAARVAALDERRVSGADERRMLASGRAIRSRPARSVGGAT